MRESNWKKNKNCWAFVLRDHKWAKEWNEKSRFLQHLSLSACLLNPHGPCTRTKDQLVNQLNHVQTPTLRVYQMKLLLKQSSQLIYFEENVELYFHTCRRCKAVKNYNIFKRLPSGNCAVLSLVRKNLRIKLITTF
jgi:hypothetical protein